DNRAALEIYEEQVKSFGFRATTVESGVEAIAELKKAHSKGDILTAWGDYSKKVTILKLV
ncbi:MAG: hypothetical protein HQK64_10835, partial [Desulfamplus sp.]|nr:hypothetical protein [Desulfamplus sp.]